MTPSPAEQPSLAEILPFLPGRPPQQIAEVLARIAPGLPHGCAPQVLAAVVIDYLPPTPGALNRTAPPPDTVWPDAVLAELEDFLRPEEAEYRLRRAIREWVFRLSCSGMPGRRQLERDHGQFGEWDRGSGDFVLRVASVSRLIGQNCDTIICRHLGLNAKDAAAFVVAQRAAHLAGAGHAEIAATLPPTPAAASTEGTVPSLGDHYRGRNAAILALLAPYLEQLQRDDLPLKEWPSVAADVQAAKQQLGLTYLPRAVFRQARIAKWGVEKMQAVARAAHGKRSK